MSYLKSYDFSLLTEKVIFTDNTQNEKIILNGENNLFKNNNQLLEIEIGSGNGHLLNRLAFQNRIINYIGIEKREKRIIRCREKQIKNNTENLIWICGEAFASMEKFINDEIVDRMMMTFPDPWPKNRHAKNRLFKSKFVELFYSKLKKGGEFIFVTDDQPYFNEASSIAKEHSGFRYDESLFDDVLTESLFGDRWKKDNRTIFQFRLYKK